MNRRDRSSQAGDVSTTLAIPYFSVTLGPFEYTQIGDVPFRPTRPTRA